MKKEDILERSYEQAVKYIESMNSAEIGLCTLRKAFEMGYIQGGFQAINSIEQQKGKEDEQ